MGNGTMKCKSYRTNKGYCPDKDYDDRGEGDFSPLLPLYGNDNERFFYVTKEKGGYTVDGECYIITSENRGKRAVRNFQREPQKVPI